MKVRSLLHVGCGSDPLPEYLSEFRETRLDIDESLSPDIVANMTDMGDIGGYDVVLCQHALEHLQPYDVPIALSEFLRVLNAGGMAIIFVPDLEDVRATDDVILQSPAGPITGLDMIYGYGQALKEWPYMAHRTGFVANTLENALKKANFRTVETKRMGNYNLMGIGVK